MRNINRSHRLLALVLALSLLGGALLTFCSCTGGNDGANGLSAYEIAVKNGFEGSESEWLASLKGENGSDGTNGKDAASGSTTTDERLFNEALLSSVSIYCAFTEEKTSSLFPSLSDTTTTSAGSGVIYKMNREEGDAYIITNYHVVYNANALEDNHISQNIRVYLYGMYFDGTDNMNTTGIAAEYVGGSMNYDIAVLKITDSDKLRNSDAMPVKVANSNELSVGTTALAIGNPQGNGISVTSGVVSVESEHIRMLGVDNLTTVTLRVIRIDTAVNSGNSGGGLFNQNGELIGIVNAKIVTSNVENIGYAIPSNVAVYVAENILDNCDGKENLKVKKCLVGISVQTVDSKAVYNEEDGTISLYDTVQIVEVTDTSLVKGILQEGDILTAITLDGVNYPVCRQHDLIDIVLNARVGSTIVLTALRNGEEVSFSGTFSAENVSTVE